MEKSTEWKAGFEAARHQAANLIGHLIVDEINDENLAWKCSERIRIMEDNGTIPTPDNLQ